VAAKPRKKRPWRISGHRTRAVFDRYHIISDRRMKQNAEKLGEHLKAKENPPKESAAGTDKSGGRIEAVWNEW
jgi:hypothetical protein